METATHADATAGRMAVWRAAKAGATAGHIKIAVDTIARVVKATEERYRRHAQAIWARWAKEEAEACARDAFKWTSKPNAPEFQLTSEGHCDETDIIGKHAEIMERQLGSER